MTDSGIASKATSSPSSAARSDHSAMTVPSEMRGGSGDSLRRQAVGRHTGSVSVTNSSHQFGKIEYNLSSVSFLHGGGRCFGG